MIARLDRGGGLGAGSNPVSGRGAQFALDDPQNQVYAGEQRSGSDPRTVVNYALVDHLSDVRAEILEAAAVGVGGPARSSPA